MFPPIAVTRYAANLVGIELHARVCVTIRWFSDESRNLGPSTTF